MSIGTFQFTARLGLTGVMEAILSSGLIARGKTTIRLIVEGLMSHFFHPDRPSYALQDVLWFLELVNQQEQWCFNANTNKAEENVVEEPATKTRVSWKKCFQDHPLNLVCLGGVN